MGLSFGKAQGQAFNEHLQAKCLIGYVFVLHFNPHKSDPDIIVPILQKRKLRLRGIQCLALEHVKHKQKSYTCNAVISNRCFLFPPSLFFKTQKNPMPIFLSLLSYEVLLFNSQRIVSFSLSPSFPLSLTSFFSFFFPLFFPIYLSGSQQVFFLIFNIEKYVLPIFH